MSEEKTIKIADVVIRDDLYPRSNRDMATVERYRQDLDVLPPIEINQRNELIDGYHRSDRVSARASFRDRVFRHVHQERQ